MTCPRYRKVSQSWTLGRDKVNRLSRRRSKVTDVTQLFFRRLDPILPDVVTSLWLTSTPRHRLAPSLALSARVFVVPELLPDVVVDNLVVAGNIFHELEELLPQLVWFDLEELGVLGNDLDHL